MTNPGTKIDPVSFQLGMINCFCEMVACGVKKLALSPPISPEGYPLIKQASRKIAEGFRIKSYLETALLITDLQPAEFTEGKWSILYYKNEDVLDKYLALKEKKDRLESLGKYSESARRETARAFGRLLSYPASRIEAKISGTAPAPFMLIP
jgi:hypothetical protein